VVSESEMIRTSDRWDVRTRSSRSTSVHIGPFRLLEAPASIRGRCGATLRSHETKRPAAAAPWLRSRHDS
jgi:hypothetical protein